MLKKLRNSLQRNFAVMTNHFISVQNKTKSKSNVGPLQKQDGDKTSDKKMNELINIYFSCVLSAEGDSPIPTLLTSEETLRTTFFDFNNKT